MTSCTYPASWNVPASATPSSAGWHGRTLRPATRDLDPFAAPEEATIDRLRSARRREARVDPMPDATPPVLPPEAPYSCPMSSIRLFILGALDRRGPMHGHQLRRTAEQERTERWADVTVGALYGALKRMATDGSIEVHAIERDGELPSRRVYAITDRGRDELASIRDELLRDARLRSDPIDLALHYSDDLPASTLRDLVEQRRLTLVAELDSWRDLLEVAGSRTSGDSSR